MPAKEEPIHTLKLRLPEASIDILRAKLTLHLRLLALAPMLNGNMRLLNGEANLHLQRRQVPVLLRDTISEKRLPGTRVWVRTSI